jgi:hypothetical protein
MPHTASTVPGYRNPWTQGAYAYPEADTFAAAKEGMKRKRKPVMFHMPNTGEAGNKTCVTCGAKLKDLPDMENAPFETSGGNPTPDKWSTWNYDPKTKSVVGGQHYGCSWGALLTRISQIRSF